MILSIGDAVQKVTKFLPRLRLENASFRAMMSKQSSF